MTGVAAKLLQPGDPAPWFTARATSNPKFQFDTVGGRYVLLAFLGSAARPEIQDVLAKVAARLELFSVGRLVFFGVSADPTDESTGRLLQRGAAFQFFFDTDLAVSRLYGALAPAPEGAGHAYVPHLLLLDPMLRVIATAPLGAVEPMLDLASRLPPIDLHAGVEQPAPALILPRVFEREFCRCLIELYERQGGQESGFMREQEGRTVGMVDHGFKRRTDCQIEDEELRAAFRARLTRRLVPEIEKVFQFKVTRIERYIVACYDAVTGGHFRAHRDNTTKGTAHRRFAVSINLNAEEYEGGDLRFPEFGSRLYRAPTGGCVVFSCSLLHEVVPVTRGKRYATLPFLYDDAAARIRDQNRAFLGAADQTAGDQGPIERVA